MQAKLVKTRNGKTTYYKMNGQIDIFATLCNRHPIIILSLWLVLTIATQTLIK